MPASYIRLICIVRRTPFVCLFLCFHHLGSQTFHQNKQIEKPLSTKRKQEDTACLRVA